ncbi:hypothetical protein II906_01235 [bacterium]|nr:hypothetical protein [bacterium]
MNKEIISIALALGCVSSIATTNNYDLLGRKGSKMNTPMVYKNVDYSKFKKKEQEKLNSSLENRGLAKMASGIKGNTKAIVGKFGPKGYSFAACSNGTKGCGESISISSGNLTWSQYLTKVNDYFIDIVSQQKDRNSHDFNYVTAGPTRSISYTMEETPFNFSGGVMTYESALDSTKTLKYAPGYYLNDYLNRSFVYKSNVGVYLSGLAAPVRLNEQSDTYAPFIVADNGSINSFAKTPREEMIAAKMYRIVHWFSDRSSVFASRNRPSNPAGENPQIYMGLHGDNASGTFSYYPAKAKDLDNYIYNKRTVEVVAAGNNASGNFSHKGHAINAITVGAFDPTTNKPTTYSAYKDPKYCNGCDSYHKPEVYNYSNFYIDDKYRKYKSGGIVRYRFVPFYAGTEAAAAVTASEISNMLSYNEFYKWHPEVVKSVVLNSKGYVAKYDELIFDQKDKKNLHHSYYFIGDVNTLMKEYGASVCDESRIYGKRKEIRLKGYLSNLATPSSSSSFTSNSSCKVEGFTASIAWLNSGNDIVNLGNLPQNFEIETFWETERGIQRLYDSSIYHAESNGVKNSYKTIGFERQTSGRSENFIISIALTEEDSRSENYGQMVLGLDIKPLCK